MGGLQVPWENVQFESIHRPFHETVDTTQIPHFVFAFHETPPRQNSLANDTSSASIEIPTVLSSYYDRKTSGASYDDRISVRQLGERGSVDAKRLDRRLPEVEFISPGEVKNVIDLVRALTKDFVNDNENGKTQNKTRLQGACVLSSSFLLLGFRRFW